MRGMALALAGAACLLLALPPAARGDTAAVEAAVAETQRLLGESDSYAAIDYLDASGTDVEVLTAYQTLVGTLYWKDKNLGAAVAMSRAGIQFALDAARRLDGTDAKLAAWARDRAKVMTYNLASFVWPGWDEPGIEISERDLEFGLDAARANLRLAEKLEPGALPKSRGHWIVGAHLLAAGQVDLARTEFEEAARQAYNGGAVDEELLSRGYVALCAVLLEEEGAAEALEKVKGELVKLGSDAASLAEQLDVALRVFGG